MVKVHCSLFFKFLFIVLSATACAQSVYKLNTAADVLLGTVSGGAFCISLLTTGVPGDAVPDNEINGLDRIGIYAHNSTLDKIGTVSCCVSLALPIISAAGRIDDFSAVGTYALMYAEAFFLTSGIKELLKDSVSRWRPYTYFDDVHAYQGEDDYYNSFPSGHTAYAFMGATFLATTLFQDYAGKSWAVPVTIAAYTSAAACGILRVCAGEHFITDVLAGAVIGSICGWLIPFIHSRI